MEQQVRLEASQDVRPPVATTGTGPTFGVREVVRQLSSNKREEREAAGRALHVMGPAAVQELLEVIQEEREKRRRQQRLHYSSVALVVGIPILLLIGAGILKLTTGHGPDVGSFLSSYGAFAAMAGGAAAFSNRHKSAVSALAKVGDESAVEPLVQALEVPDRQVRDAVKDALVRLLPLLKPSDSKVLSVDAQRMLCKTLLKTPNGPGLSGAILAGLKARGDGESVPAVREVAQGQRRPEHGEDVRAAARDCLQELEARALRLKASGTLLRPTAHSDDEPLLRPASSVGSTEAEALLRASGPAGA